MLQLAPKANVFSLSHVLQALSLFQKQADLKAEGIFRIQPKSQDVDRLEDLILQGTSAVEPAMNDSYALANLFIRAYQQGLVLPLSQENHVDVDILSHWMQFASSLKTILPFFKQNVDTGIIDRAISEAFITLMSGLSANQYQQSVQAIHGFLQVCQQTIAHSAQNKMDLNALSHQLCACFLSCLELEHVLIQENLVAQWKISASILKALLSQIDFNQEPIKLYTTQTNATMVKKFKKQFKAANSEDFTLETNIVAGKGTLRQQALFALISNNTKSAVYTPNYSQGSSSSAKTSRSRSESSSEKSKDKSKKPK